MNNKIPIRWRVSRFLLFSSIALFVFMWGFFLGAGIQEGKHLKAMEAMADQCESSYDSEVKGDNGQERLY